MHKQDLAIVKSLVTVAWADGRIASEENDVIEALLSAFDATPAEVALVRDYAREPKALEDVPLTDLHADDRRILLQHAVLLTFIDGAQHEKEKALLLRLAAHLRIAEAERDQLLHAATERAKRLLGLL